MAFAAASAQATEFAGTWTLSELNTSDPGLVVNATKTTGSFDIANGVLTASSPTTTINLFDLYTNEGSIEKDDKTPLPIQLTFTFTTPSPTSGGVINGTTVGQETFLGVFQDGVLNWADSGVTDVNFGTNLSGLLTIGVNGGAFNTGLFGLDKGKRAGLDVSATFDWVNDPTSGGVPEPASWALMIAGFGMAGATLRRRRVAVAAA
ncbi:MAG: PEP-CTERM sorting domain-containing protein [Phenylobacterium sp.]|nr:MAG: PEP-CTERM sorting domain-containing protein [Phenylobacterium sp.]